MATRPSRASGSNDKRRIEAARASQRRGIAASQSSSLPKCWKERLYGNPAKVSISAAAPSAAGAETLPTFSMTLYAGGPMRLSGWGQTPVVVDLAGMKPYSTPLPVFRDHDPGKVVGHATKLQITAREVALEGVISGAGEDAAEIVQSSKNGFEWKASMGADPLRVDFLDEGSTDTVNEQEVSGPCYIVRESTLGEASFVPLAADVNTQVQVAAQAAEREGEPAMKFNEWLKARGFDPAALSDAEKKTLKAAFDNEPEKPVVEAAKPAAEKPVVEAAKPAAAEKPADGAESIRAEHVRIGKIKTATAGHPDVEAKAIADGWTPEQAELEVLRASRPQAPAVNVPGQVATPLVLQAACEMQGLADGIDKRFEPAVLEAAQKRFSRGIGLFELMVEAARANGYTGRGFRDHREVMRYAFGRGIAAGGFSTVDIGGILSGIANKYLLAGFMSVEMTWRQIAAIRSVSDFKTITSYRLTGKDQYEKVLPGGKLNHGTLGEESFTNKADTYGLMLSIDRRDIINDDLGAITSVPRKLGRGSGLKINDVFWTVFMANTALFTAALKNYSSGATTALSIDALTAAEQLFNDMVDVDGKPTGVAPQILLVPTALGAYAAQLFKALELRDTTGSTKYPTANPHSGKYAPAVSRYLGNSSYTGHSQKAWYLLANPQDVAVVEVAFLNGQESPTIETAEAEFERLGVDLRGYHDFGVARQDPKGGVKMKGEA